MRVLIVCAALATGLLLPTLPMATASAETRSLAVGDIVIRYDDTRFVRSDNPLIGAGIPEAAAFPVVVAFGCADEFECRDDAIVVVSASLVSSDGDDEPPSRLTIALDEDDRYETRPLWTAIDSETGYQVAVTRNFGGLNLFGGIRHSRCRARAPSTLEASGVHDGIQYRFSSGMTHLCGGIEGFSRDMFDEFLAGVSIAPQADP